MNDTTLPQRKAVCKRWLRDEEIIDLIMPSGRRENNGTYCKSNLRHFPDLDRYFHAIDQCTHFVDLVSVINRNSRYDKLNLLSYATHSTFEFRQHSGTTDADKIIHWITFLDSFIASSLEERFIRKWNRNHNYGPVTQVIKMMWSASVPKATWKFYEARAMQFFTQESPGGDPWRTN